MPPKGKRDQKGTVPIPKKEQSDNEWDSSDDEPLHLLGQHRLIPFSETRRDDEDTGTTEETATNEFMQSNACRTQDGRTMRIAQQKL